MNAHSSLWLLALITAGCWSNPPDLRRPDAGSAPEGGALWRDAGAGPRGDLTAMDARGNHWPLDAIPRRPRLRMRSSAPVASEGVFLFDGAPGAALEADLERPPLLVGHQARKIECEVRRVGDAVELRPRLPLRPGQRLTLAVAAWAGPSAPIVHSLRVASLEAGAILVATWPADGTAGVPSTIPMLALRFDDDVVGLEGIELTNAAGVAVPIWVTSIDCLEIGWPDGSCGVVYPDVPLAAGVEHLLSFDERLLDRTGASVGPAGARFVTSPVHDAVAPELVTIECGLDEVAVTEGCALFDDHSYSLRMRATGPMRAFLRTDAGEAVSLAPRGDISLRLGGLIDSLDLPAELELVDLSGTRRLVLMRVRTTEPLAPVSITEIRPDPAGPEPHQEYVEVLNSGDVPLDLEGYAIADRADRGGDVIATRSIVPARARALIVGDGFDPLHPDDAPVPPGVVLVRVGSSIASGGLSNAGEPLYLRDPLGRRVSAAPSLPSPGSGSCLVRISPDARESSPDSFGVDAAGGCTPGAADRLPSDDGTPAP